MTNHPPLDPATVPTTEEKLLNALDNAEKERDKLKSELDELQSSLASIQELHATPGKMELHIKEHPLLAQYFSKCFAELVASSPNYTECRFDRVVLIDGKPEFVTVHIQKQSGKTPHQLRLEAEKQRDELKAKLEAANRQCAEMRDLIKRMANLEEDWSDADYKHALSANCGTGYFSREQVMPLTKSLNFAAKAWNCNDNLIEQGHKLYDVHCEAAQALSHAAKIGLEVTI